MMFIGEVEKPRIYISAIHITLHFNCLIIPIIRRLIYLR